MGTRGRTAMWEYTTAVYIFITYPLDDMLTY
jgi:hypothetical protein